MPEQRDQAPGGIRKALSRRDDLVPHTRSCRIKGDALLKYFNFTTLLYSVVQSHLIVVSPNWTGEG
jgi:hypothetical protein